MRKFIILLVLILSACSKDQIIDKYDDIRTVKNIPVSKEVNAPIIPHVWFYPELFKDYPIPVEVDIKKIIKEKTGVSDVSKHVEDIELTYLAFELNSETIDNFDFLKSMSLCAKLDGENEIELGKVNNISSDLKTLIFETTNKKLDKYIKSDKMVLKIRYVSNKTVKDYKSVMKMKFKVKVKVKK